jgi:hypothetical protein
MLPQFLLPETIARQDGTGAEVACDQSVVQLTLGITRIIAQESLEVSVWGSADGSYWRNLVKFPPKFYCGVYSLVLDLTGRPDVRYVRAQWKMTRWIRDNCPPMFGFYVRAESGRLRREAGAG